MPILELPHADFFDSVVSLDLQIELAQALFSPASALSTSIPSFLMWQDAFTYALARKDNCSFIIALYGPYVYLPVPPRPFTVESLQTSFDYMKKVNGSGPGISRVEGLIETQKEQAQTWKFSPRLTLSEYVYDRKYLADLHGDPYRAKRAEINHFLKKNAVILRPYRVKDLKTCGDLYELWKSQRLPFLHGEMGEKMIQASQKAHFRALCHGEDWGMDAWVVLVDQRIAAYTVGSALNPTTYGIYVEVTDLTIKGLSAYIFANVCRQLEAYPFINTGDAEGLPLLAESKEHWHPTEKLALYAVDPRSI
jgi:uncharacterized protein